MSAAMRGTVRWKNVSTRMIDVNGTPFAYRELGPESGVPVVFLDHLMAVLDDWDPRVIDGIAEHLPPDPSRQDRGRRRVPAPRGLRPRRDRAPRWVRP